MTGAGSVGVERGVAVGIGVGVWVAWDVGVTSDDRKAGFVVTCGDELHEIKMRASPVNVMPPPPFEKNDGFMDSIYTRLCDEAHANSAAYFRLTVSGIFPP
jgi:hypothetical protein